MFDTIPMILGFVYLGRLLEDKATATSMSVVRSLVSLQPRRAMLVLPGGTNSTRSEMEVDIGLIQERGLHFISQP